MDLSAPAARRRLGKRAALLVLTGVSLYLLLPSLLEVFSSWRSLAQLDAAWAAAVVALEAASVACIWEIQRTALEGPPWFPVATSHLAGAAFGRVVPGGAGAAGALQYRMLLRAGVRRGAIAPGLAASTTMLFATLLALPVLSVPAIVAGAPVDRGLVRAAVLGAGLFVMMVATGALLFLSGRALDLVGRTGERLLNAGARRPRVRGLAPRLRRARAALLRSFGERWHTVLLAVAGRWLLDYGALLAALFAVGAHPRPSLVLLAFVTASVLGMVPLTPGGLGFVEAGLTGTLALAGVAAGDALLATLAYRLASFWLPLPAGAVAAALFGRRYGPLRPRPEAPA